MVGIKEKEAAESSQDSGQLQDASSNGRPVAIFSSNSMTSATADSWANHEQGGVNITNATVSNNTTTHDQLHHVESIELESRPAFDLYHQLHVDTSRDTVYHFNPPGSTASNFRIGEGVKPAIRRMRDHLASVLPEELIRDAYDDVIPIQDISSQHITKLQARIWHELPRMKVETIHVPETEVTEQQIVGIRSVFEIANLLAEKNMVFVLRPCSKRPCHSPLCEHVHNNLEQPHSGQEVSIEPLVDWLTLDPVSVPRLPHFALYRRNDALFDKSWLLNRYFVPKDVKKFCLECLEIIAEASNGTWWAVRQNPDILNADVTWTRSESVGQQVTNMGGDKNEQDGDSSDSSNTSDLDETIELSPPLSEPDLDITKLSPKLDGTFDDWPKRRYKKFKIWEDPQSDEEKGRKACVQSYDSSGAAIKVGGWTPINPPQRGKRARWTSTNSLAVSHAPSSPSSNSTVVAEEMTLPAPRRGVEFSARLAGSSFKETVTTADRERTEDDCGSVQGESSSQAQELVWFSPLTTTRSTLNRTPQKATSPTQPRWPTPKESTSPIAAKPAPGCDPTPPERYPWPKQIICSCKKPARTREVGLVECRDPKCPVRWYHYACLGLSGKISSLWGTFQCKACKGMEFWGTMKRDTDLSMPLTRMEVLDVWEGSGMRRPYGLGTNEVEPPGRVEMESEGYCDTVYHEDENPEEDEDEEISEAVRVLAEAEEDSESESIGEFVGETDKETDEETELEELEELADEEACEEDADEMGAPEVDDAEM